MNPLEDLSTAVISGNIRMIKHLLKYVNLDLNTQDYDGETALIKAVSYNYPEVVELLINAGADVNIHTNDGYTALIYAATTDNTKLVELLINAGADVNAHTNHGFTALILAALHGHTDIAELLINAGADVNAHTDNGYTALQLFCENNYIPEAQKKEFADLLFHATPNLEIFEGAPSWVYDMHNEIMQQHLQSFLDGTLHSARNHSIVQTLPVDVLGMIANKVLGDTDTDHN
jgi:ankyrin repeat protein